MRNTLHGPACFLLAALALSGCFDFDFGSEDVEGCSTPNDVAMRLEDRYALGAATNLSLSGLYEPEVTSSNPEVVEVGPVREDEVTLYFVGQGTASIRIREDDEEAAATVEVAPLERFEVCLPTYVDPPVTLPGKAVIDPELAVLYFDGRGRLYGGGLAETTWERTCCEFSDVFFNPSLMPGPQEVVIRVGVRRSIVRFEAVAEEDVLALSILETDLGDERVRVDLVGLTATGTQVWNVGPYFDVAQQAFFTWFEYRRDPDASAMTVIAESIPLSINGPLEAVETTIQGTDLQGPQFTITRATTAVSAGRAPIFAIISLLWMTLLIRLGVRARGA
jgi:hypothetical protein